jgi:hypothetical protein
LVASPSALARSIREFDALDSTGGDGSGGGLLVQPSSVAYGPSPSGLSLRRVSWCACKGLAAQASCAIALVFAPTATGSQAATLTLEGESVARET